MLFSWLIICTDCNFDYRIGSVEKIIPLGDGTALALLCFAFFLGFIICARMGVWVAMDNWWFENHIAPYANIVHSIKTDAIPCSQTIAHIDITNLPPHISHIHAARSSDGALIVIFVAEGSCFAGHVGYLFKDYTNTNSYIADYVRGQQFNLRHITGNWYEFSN